MVNRARPISDYAKETPAEPVQAAPTQAATLYLRLPTEGSPLFGKIRAMINMFPGDSSVVAYFADTKQRRGARCALDERLLRELRELLGNENVVVK